MEQQEIYHLLEKYKEGSASPEEIAALQNWYRETGYADATYPDNEVLVHDRIHSRLIATIQPLKTKQRWPDIRFAAAIAAAVATIVFGVWFFAYRDVASLPSNEELVQHDIAPGKNGATLSLPNGQVIRLSDAKKGVIVANGQISYVDGAEIASQARNDEMQKLTASTAKGQTYEFTLPDGTQVFLNTDSRIIFPSQFSGKERKILLEGEAYFVVKHNAKQPFRVESKAANGRSQVVEDIGTEFNINSYADESTIKTTLVEGSASVAVLSPSERERKVLGPNQQATLANGQLKVKAVEVNQYIAWKNGKFVFEYETITSVMRKLARWYNVEVVYEGDFEGKTFTGSISRFDHISRILDKISYTQDVHFKIEGRRITVMP